MFNKSKYLLWIRSAHRSACLVFGLYGKKTHWKHFPKETKTYVEVIPLLQLGAVTDWHQMEPFVTKLIVWRKVQHCFPLTGLRHAQLSSLKKNTSSTSKLCRFLGQKLGFPGLLRVPFYWQVGNTFSHSPEWNRKSCTMSHFLSWVSSTSQKTALVVTYFLFKHLI